MAIIRQSITRYSNLHDIFLLSSTSKGELLQGGGSPQVGAAAAALQRVGVADRTSQGILLNITAQMPQLPITGGQCIFGNW